MLDETKNKTRLELLEEEWRNAVEDLVLYREKPSEMNATLSRLRELNAQILAIKKADLDEVQRTAELELAQQKAKAEEIARIQSQQLEEQKAKEAKKNNVVNWIVGGLTAVTGVAGVWLGYRSWKGTMIAEATGNPPMSKSSSFVKGFYSMYRK